MRRSKIDKIDRKILKQLQDNGRITNVELAESVGISAPPCLRRVRALEEAGYIKGYHAQVNNNMLGYGVTVFALVKLTSQAEADLLKFEQRMNELSVVRECRIVAGDVDYVLKIVAKDWDDYQNFMRTELAATPNVTSVKSMLTMRATKDVPGVPVEE
ncbi:MAG: Lrp/AsnC family transcriptional regulator [Alphaproteobacteria bacterium]|nr:Lrp/AsnC family transcriptional regulator [Alphaproteobacteria bacterium]